MPATKSERPLRVLIVEDSLADNGALRMTLDFAAAIPPGSASVELYAFQPVRAGPAVQPAAGIRVTRGVPERGRIRTQAVGAVRRLAAGVRRADVVVSGSEVGLGLLLGAAVAKCFRRPFVVMGHAPLDRVLERWVAPRHRALTRVAHRNADAVICVSNAVLASELANGLDPSRAHLVPNGIDVERVRHLAKTGPPAERSVPTIVSLGRLSAEKRFDLVVRAHAQLRSAGVVHRVEILGEGPERRALQELAVDLGVADTFELPGFHENPYPRLATASAFVLTSQFEGASLASLEALALGVPVVVTPSAASGAAADGESVTVVEETPAALAAALRRYVERRHSSPPPAVRIRDVKDVAHDYLTVLRGAVRA